MNDNSQLSKNNINNEIYNEEIIENKKSNLFNIIIGIATLLIAILGATFAYFSASAVSKENDVNLRSAYLSISYEGGTKIKAENLIPSSLNVTLEEYQKSTGPRCIDANNQQVCYVYQFTISSDLDEVGTTDIIGSIKVNTNEFENLSYMIYRVNFEKDANGQTILVDNGLEDGGKIEKVSSYEPLANNFKEKDKNPDVGDYADYTFNKFSKPIENKNEDGVVESTSYPIDCLFGFSDNYETYDITDVNRCAPHTITNGEEYVYQLVVWLEETGVEQPEQKKEFGGTITIDVKGGTSSSGYSDGRITGRLSND